MLPRKEQRLSIYDSDTQPIPIISYAPNQESTRRSKTIEWCKNNKIATSLFALSIVLLIILFVGIKPLSSFSASIACGNSIDELSVASARSYTEDPAKDSQYMPKIVSNATYVGAAADEKEYMEECAYGVLPSYIDDLLVEHGWKITFMDSDVNGNPAFSFLYNLAQAIHEGDTNFYAIGHTNYFEKHIRIQATVFMLPDETILHEIGHAIDAQCGWISHDDRFNKICDRIEQNTDIWKTLQTRVDIEEKFANMFAYYLMYPERMEEQSPEMYSWFLFNIGRAPRAAKLDIDETNTLIEEIARTNPQYANELSLQQETNNISDYEEYIPSIASNIKYSNIASTPKESNEQLKQDVISMLKGKIPEHIDSFIMQRGWTFEIIDTSDLQEKKRRHRYYVNRSANSKSFRNRR